MNRPTLILGTAQLGLRYGITNTTGMPDDGAVRTILQRALDAGVTGFDTAQAYGCAEDRIGAFLSATGSRQRVTLQTKISPLSSVSDVNLKDLTESSFRRLQTDYIDVFMLHRFADIGRPDAIQALKDLKTQHRIGKIGCSISTFDEFKSCLLNPDIEFLQLPLNLLDWRWKDAKRCLEAAGRPDIAIQVRSIFLQGLLLDESESNLPHFFPKELQSRLDVLRLEAGFRSRAELCFSFIFGQRWVNSVVFGVNQPGELEELSKYFRARPLNEKELERVSKIWPEVPEHLLNPANWS